MATHYYRDYRVTFDSNTGIPNNTYIYSYLTGTSYTYYKTKCGIPGDNYYEVTTNGTSTSIAVIVVAPADTATTYTGSIVASLTTGEEPLFVATDSSLFAISATKIIRIYMNNGSPTIVQVATGTAPWGSRPTAVMYVNNKILLLTSDYKFMLMDPNQLERTSPMNSANINVDTLAIFKTFNSSSASKTVVPYNVTIGQYVNIPCFALYYNGYYYVTITNPIATYIVGYTTPDIETAETVYPYHAWMKIKE